MSLCFVQNITAQPSILDIQYTNPICFGESSGNSNTNISQTSPPTYLEVKLYFQNPSTGFWANIGNSYGANFSYPFLNLVSGQYRVQIIDTLFPTIVIEEQTFTLTDPDDLDVSGNQTNPTTINSSDGFINVSVSGCSPFTYAWSNSDTTQNISNLNANTYILTVTDTNNCIEVDTFTLEPLSNCYAGNINENSVTCYLSGDGQISISNVYGISPYSFSIDTANPYLIGYVQSSLYQDTIISNSSFLFDNLIEGDYFVAFEDNVGCVDSVLIPYNIGGLGSQFNIDTVINFVSDTTLSDGSIVINNIQGGIGSSYNFIWYDSLGTQLQNSSSNSLLNLGVGNYSVKIIDNSIYGCSDSVVSLVVGVRQSCVADSVIVHNVCPARNEGSIKINYLDGWDDYQFYDSSWVAQWPSGIDSIGNLSAGTYYFRLDSLTPSSCPVDTMILEVLEPIIDNIYIVDAVTGNTLCAGDSSRILVNVFNPDTASFRYFYYLGGILPGTQVGDTTARYYFLNTYFIGLQYHDGNGFLSCPDIPGDTTYFKKFKINEYVLGISNVFASDEVCGVSSATLNIEIDSANISNMPVSYFINGDSILASAFFTETFDIFHSTVYDSIYIKDALGCKVHWNSFVVADQIINTKITDTIFKESCNGNDGEIHLLLQNGQGNYSFVLSKMTPFNVPLDIDSGFNILDSIIIDSLVSGTYFIEIIDDSMCVSLDTFVVTQVLPLNLLSLTKIEETCCGYDGSIEVNVNVGDGTNLTYTLEFDTIAITIANNNNNYPYTDGNDVWPSQAYLTSFSSSQSSPFFDSLTRGYYSIYVEDEYGCVDSADYSDFIASGNSGINTHLSIDDSYVIDMSSSYTDVVCFGDTNATIKVLYPDACYSYELLLYSSTATYSLIAVDSISSLDTSVYYNQLYAGIYGIQGMSTSGFDGCVRRSDIDTIIEPEIISYDSPLSTAAFCLNNGFALNGGSCDGTVFLPNVPIGGVYDTSAVAGDTVYQYYIKGIVSFIAQDTLVNSYFQGPIIYDSIFTGLCPGEYEIQVLDGNNCIIKDTISVADSSLYINSLLVTTISCHDSSDASILVDSVIGGVGNYDYVWTNSTNNIVSSNQLADNLSEGMYFVTVSDSTGCNAVDSAFISKAPDLLELYGRVPGFKSKETCYRYSYDGYVGYEVKGGSGPYVFNWINSDSSRFGSYTAYAEYCIGCISSDGISSVDSVYILDSLTTDIYKVTLTDINSCSSFNWFPIDSINIEAQNINNLLSIDSVNLSSSLCYGASYGSIEFFMNNSVMSPLFFELDSNLSNSNDSLTNSTGFFSSLGANTYNILITDSFGCFIDTTYTINQLNKIVVSDSVIDLSCFESDNGEVYISVSGGLVPYSYSWSGPGLDPITPPTNQNISNLTDGNYILEISYKTLDDSTCLAYHTIEVMTVTPLLSTIVQAIDALCNDSSDAYGSISVSGGVGPYQYSWNEVGSSIVLSADSSISNIGAGTYTAHITDFNGCRDSINVTFNESPLLYLEVEDISHNLCDGDSIGSISLIANGGTSDYVTYFIESSSGDIKSGPSNQFDGLVEGVYMLWVEDSNGCLSIEIDAEIKEPGKIDLNLSSYNLKCFESDDGEIEIIFNGGAPPYKYNLNNLDSGIVFQQFDTLSIENLPIGFYNFDVIDYNNCKNSISISIDQPLEVIASFNVDQDLILKGNMVTVNNLSTGASHFSWNFGDNLNISNEFELSYTYRDQGSFMIELVANNNNNLYEDCNDTAYIDVNVEGYDINNVFTPNNDGVNDEYHFGDEMLVELEVSIYNRWGQQVYAFDNLNGSWDGKSFNGEIMPEGVYFFIMKAVGSLGDSYFEEGSITLLR